MADVNVSVVTIDSGMDCFEEYRMLFQTIKKWCFTTSISLAPLFS